ncbi:MAG: C-GCAxxG-C-C family (seleno)protein [Thermoleophilia bacterium]
MSRNEIEGGVALSRRDLLKGAGKFSAVGGLALVSGAGLGVLAGCESSETKTVTTSSAESATLPWPYMKLDAASIKQLQETAHGNWFKGFCAFATLSGIMTQLREKIGAPWTGYPMEAIIYGHGGTAGWGGTCGTLIGAGMAASLAAGPKIGEEIVNDVIKWYTETELPIYKPDAPKATITAVSVSNSPLCHISVGKWMKKEGVGFLSPQQMERCGRLSADVAAKTAEYLNMEVDKQFVAANKSQVTLNGMPSQNNCTDCHGTNIPAVPKPGGGESLIESS